MLRPLFLALRTSLLVSLLASLALAQSSSPSPQERYYEQGQRALQAGRFAEAEAAYEKLRQLEPGVAEVHANLGLIYFEERKFDQAVPALRQALKLNPALSNARVLLAMSLSELGRYKEALPGLEDAFRHSSDSMTRRMCGLQLERAYTGLELDRNAVNVALELARLYPDDPEVLYHNGKIFGNFAFLTMQRLAQVAPSSLWRHLAEAEAYESQGAYDAAISEYKKVLELDPRRPGIHYQLGRALLRRSHQTNAPAGETQAVAEFTTELELNPSNANAAYEIAEIHRNAGEFDAAQKFFERALKYHQDFEEAQLGLAAVLLSQQKPGLALPHLQKAIALDPASQVSWYRLAQAYRALGNTAEQRKAFAEFQRLRSSQPSQQESAQRIFSPSEVTPQRLDPNAR